MGGEPIAVLFGRYLTFTEFLAVIEGLGGGRGVEATPGAVLRRGDRTVWIEFYPAGEGGEEDEPDDAPYIEDRLGGPVAARTILTPSHAEGAGRDLFEVVAALADRWPLVVDRLTPDPVTERIVTFDQVRTAYEAGEPFPYYDPVEDGTA